MSRPGGRACLAAAAIAIVAAIRTITANAALSRGTGSGRITSTIDSDVYHDRKSSSQRFEGFKLSAAVSNIDVPLIMAVHVAPGGEPDGPQAKHLIDAEPQERRPGRILADTAYGKCRLRKEFADRDVDVLASVPESEIVDGRVAKRDFVVDLGAETVTCPAGHTATVAPEQRFSLRVWHGRTDDGTIWRFQSYDDTVKACAVDFGAVTNEVIETLSDSDATSHSATMALL